MKIMLKEGEVEEKILEFYLVGLDGYDDFDIVNDVLTKQFNCSLLDSIDGIWVREGTYVTEEMVFKIIYHEDVGIYSFAIGEQKTHINDKLREILNDVITYVQTYL